LAEELPAAKRLTRGECIHCHQVNEFRREQRKAEGAWHRDDRWVYPLPDNVGILLEHDAGNRVESVKPDSPAARAGLKAGDLLVNVNGIATASFADVQYGLHRAPKAGTVLITWQRGSQTTTGKLELTEGWRWTNLTWRPSLLDLLPSFPLYGPELTVDQKKKLGLGPKHLAFRQGNPVSREAKAAGVLENDVVIGIDGRPVEMSLLDFLAHVRRNHLVGDRIVLNVVRGGKRIDLPLTLR
jgi:S1-C subfamily serine protease